MATPTLAGGRRADLALLLLRLTGLGLALGQGLGKITALAAGETRFVSRVGELGFPAPELFAWGAGSSSCARIPGALERFLASLE